jgi:hypothetical protein
LKKVLASVGVVALVGAALATVAGTAGAAKGGNSANAKLCQKNGWTTLYDTNGAPFASQGACVSYGAQGGVYGTPPAVAVLAWAYTNLDGAPGFNPSADVEIARLDDTTGDGVPSAGDTMTMGRYPLNLNPAVAADFGAFGVTQHTVTGIIVNHPDGVLRLEVGAGKAASFVAAVGVGEQYLEASFEAPDPLEIFDAIAANSLDDRLFVPTDTPSAPGSPVGVISGGDQADGSFIDVDLPYLSA